MPRSTHLHPSDLHGLSQLMFDGVIGTTSLVEQLHGNILQVASPLARSGLSPTQAVTGGVYRTIHGLTRVIGSGTRFGFEKIVPRLGQRDTTPQRERMLAVFNGVLGDHLEASDNPLVIPMRLRHNGQALLLDPKVLDRQLGQPGGKLLIAIHGLCMNDLQWTSQSVAANPCLPTRLSQRHGYSPLYLNYNSGRHISTNGRELAELLEQLVAAWPVPVQEMVLLGHSMGGLIARSACHYGDQAEHDWPQHLRKLIMLGSPHHGAPLERIGNKVDRLLGLTPYSAPFARLGQIRSAGITDLRHGNLLDEDWHGPDSQASAEDRRQPVQHLAHVDYHAVAATTAAHPDSFSSRWIGDGLVPLASALGQHPDPRRQLLIPDHHQLIVPSTTHLGLLHNPQVHATIETWLR